MSIVWSLLALIIGVVVAYLIYEEYVVEREKKNELEAEKEIEDDLQELATEAGVNVAPLPEQAPTMEVEVADVDIDNSIDSLPERVSAENVEVEIDTEIAEEPAEAEVIEEVTVAEVVEEAAPVETPEPDDLTKVKGIGHVYAQRLNDAGIYTYQQLIDTDTEKLIGITQAIPAANAHDWGRQAQKLI